VPDCVGWELAKAADELSVPIELVRIINWWNKDGNWSGDFVDLDGAPVPREACVGRVRLCAPGGIR
jgi:hypothetical protein